MRNILSHEQILEETGHLRVPIDASVSKLRAALVVGEHLHGFENESSIPLYQRGETNPRSREVILWGRTN